MDRLELLAALRRVSPAISSKGFLPILSHVCFDGKWVTAYDDVVALRTPCKCGFKGCLPGDRLISLLNSSRAAEALFEDGTGELNLKLGRTRVRFASLPPEDFAFAAPSTSKGISVPLSSDMVKALRIALKSSGKDTAAPSRLGVTACFGEKRLVLYATDNFTVVRASVKNRAPELAGQSMILLDRFLDLSLSMQDAMWVVAKNNYLMSLSSEVQLFGKVLQGANGSQFEKIFEAAKIDDLTMAEMPTNFRAAMERAFIVNKELTRFSYEEGRLAMDTVGDGVEVHDRVKADFGPSPISVASSSLYMLRYLQEATHLGFSKGCIVFSGEGFKALVGVQSASEE